jgi:hypothetical protein
MVVALAHSARVRAKCYSTINITTDDSYSNRMQYALIVESEGDAYAGRMYTSAESRDVYATCRLSARVQH